MKTVLSALSSVTWAFLGASILVACGEPQPLLLDDSDEPVALSQAPLALRQNSDGVWEWADRRVASPNLQAIWGNSTTDVWAAGSGSGTLHWNGTSWRRIANPGMGETIWSLWGTGPNNVYAIGDNGLCMRWNGSSWRRIELPIPSGIALNDIWGSGANDIWIVGDDGLVVRYNGTNWAVVPTTGVNSLWSVWGSGNNNIWMVGELGYMLKWDGTKLDEFSSGGSTLYARVRGFSSNKIWMLTNAGYVSAWDGMRWGTASTMLTGGMTAGNLFVNNDTSIWFTNSSETTRWNGMTAVRYSNGDGNALWTQGTSDGWLVGNSAAISRLSSTSTSFSSRW
ncbi:MAG: hypothetical protein JNJ46_31545 [Myxococcales bacterium]|nr:hypothetical protein [Myxococcales bacterium]